MICLLPRSLKIVAYRQLLTIRAWVEKGIAISASMVRPSPQKPDEDVSSEGLSELAAQNLFQWTYFSDGTRSEEKPLWKHEWLELLIEWESNANACESSSSESDSELLHQRMGPIRRWQEDVSASAKTASNASST